MRVIQAEVHEFWTKDVFSAGLTAARIQFDSGIRVEEHVAVLRHNAEMFCPIDF